MMAKTRMLHYALPAAALLVLAAALSMLLPSQDFTPHRDPAAMIGQPLPQLDLPPLNSGQTGFRADAFKGHVTLVNIFASWCIACRAEHPLLVKLNTQGVVTVGIAYKDKPQNTRNFLAAFGDPFSSVARDEDGKIGALLGLSGVPETYLIDQQGIIRFRHAGPLTAAVVSNEILPLIAKLNRADGPSATTGQ